MLDQVPCQFCGRPTSMTATRKCDGCWLVARGLDGFIRTEAGRLYAKKALALEAASRKLTAQPLPEGE